MRPPSCVVLALSHVRHDWATYYRPDVFNKHGQSPRLFRSNDVYSEKQINECYNQDINNVNRRITIARSQVFTYENIMFETAMLPRDTD